MIAKYDFNPTFNLFKQHDSKYFVQTSLGKPYDNASSDELEDERLQQQHLPAIPLTSAVNDVPANTFVANKGNILFIDITKKKHAYPIKEKFL